MTALPFNDEEIQTETSVLLEQLDRINGEGFLTINSQPNVNGVPSDNETFGWGGSGGYIYQKAYLEFFMPKKYIKALRLVLKDLPQVNYHIIDNQVWKSENILQLIDIVFYTTPFFARGFYTFEKLQNLSLEIASNDNV